MHAETTCMAATHAHNLAQRAELAQHVMPGDGDPCMYGGHTPAHALPPTCAVQHWRWVCIARAEVWVHVPNSKGAE